MKIKLIHHDFVKVIDVDPATTLKDVYQTHIGKKRPMLIQVGGALGELFQYKDISRTLESLEFYEDSLSFYEEVCPVDLSRFMIRFVIREQNIVNDNLKKIYGVIDGLTNGQASEMDYQLLFLMLEFKPKTLGEKLLYNNLNQLLSWYEDVFKEHLDGYCSFSICRGLMKAQCINACPAHIHIPGFVALMKDQRYEDAYRLMRHENPLSAVCGYVCARPCEDKCRRGQITGTVGVRALQRFISTKALDEWKAVDECLAPSGKTISIIGGGPCGLTAAYYLKKSGHDVVIYEKYQEAGGMLTRGIPLYRLPKDEIEREISSIESLGVVIKTNVEVGKDIDLKYIQSISDAVLIATGAPIGKQLTLDHKHVMSGLDFLQNQHSIGKNVLVIGGGDVAMDCGRTARRMASNVYVACLESYEFMPASLEEKLQAAEEGVQFLNEMAIDSIQNQKIFFKTCTDMYTDEGIFSPKFKPSDITIESIDTIICAIGQLPDLSFVEDEEMLYFAGDVQGSTIVIDAIAQGKMVAKEIHESLGGQSLFLGDDVAIPEKVLNIRTFDDDLRNPATLDVAKRQLNFEQVNLNYTLEDALYEASRCMRCDRNSTVSLQLGR